jgi:hypothetical protein
MPQYQFLFLLFLCFRKVTREIFSELDETKPEVPIFSDGTESKAETEEGQEAATPLGGAPPSGHARLWCGPLVHPLTSPFRLYILSDAKTPNQSVSVHEKFRSAATIEDQFWGDRSLCSGTLPRRGIAPGTISIDSTAISIAVAVSHDEERVVLP